MRYLLAIIIVFVNLSCATRAKHCIEIGNQTVCLKRKVWGLNGDKVWITTNHNSCQDSSDQTDFVTNNLRQGDEILYKIEGQTLYIYGESFSAPRVELPVKIIFESYKYNPDNPDSDEQTASYQVMNLKADKGCISDLF